MSELAPFALAGAALVGVGLYGLVAPPGLLRRVIGFNLAGSGVFLLLGAFARRAPETPDPVPHALIITGIVVAFSATALALALVSRLAELTGCSRLPEEAPGEEG